MAENPSNIVPDQIILLEGGSKLVPAASSSDSGKVLSVLNSDGDIGWAEGQGGTVDQTYDASSTNAQSGTAVAEAVGTPVNLVQGSGITLTESSGNVTISADAQLPASTLADATKVLTVDSSGVPGWAPAASGGVPVLHSLSCEVYKGYIEGEFPEGEYLEPGLYQVFISFAMSEYNASYRHIAYGYQAEHSEWLSGSEYYPVGVDANGPFSSSRATFVRTGYLKVTYHDEVSGLRITFQNGTSSVTGSDILNHVSVNYMKVADLS